MSCCPNVHLETAPGNRTGSDRPPRTLVVGLGETGLSCVRFLLRQGAQVAVTDTREQPPGLARLQQECPDAAVYLGGFSSTAFAAAQMLVVSPGVALEEPLIEEAKARGVEVIGDIELFARHRQAPVVAITGSNGKSTVTTLVGEMARAARRRTAVGGNLGPPALDLLPGPEDPQPDLYVLELSSFQLALTSGLEAEVATVLNLSPDHLDRHSSLEHYAELKGRILQGSGIAVLNADDPLSARLAPPSRSLLRFSLGVPENSDDYGLIPHRGENWLARGTTQLLPASSLRLSGRHNLANALAALALGEAVGLPRGAMLEVLRGFRGLPHRTQWVADKAGVAWYDDSKGTNVNATLAALDGMPGPLVWIAGGQGKGADFTPLRKVAADKVRAAVLLGQDAPLLAAALGDSVPIEHARSIPEAVTMAARLAQPGDRVLLSPACASFDMFADYKQRGQRFAASVRALADRRGPRTTNTAPTTAPEPSEGANSAHQGDET